MPDEELLTLARFAHEVGVKERVVLAWGRTGLVRLVRGPHSTFVPVSEVARLRRQGLPPR
jgi:hypothetical protein